MTTAPEAVVPLEAFVPKATVAVTVAPAVMLVAAGVTVREAKVLAAGKASWGVARKAPPNSNRVAINRNVSVWLMAFLVEGEKEAGQLLDCPATRIGFLLSRAIDQRVKVRRLCRTAPGNWSRWCPQTLRFH